MPRTTRLLSILLPIAAAALLAACTGENAGEAVTEVSIADFNANAESYADRTVAITGIVDHVCRHGGKKLFIVGESPEDRLKIEVGELGAFDVTLEGSEVRFEGKPVIVKIDDAYLDRMEAEAVAAGAEAGNVEQVEALREDLRSCASEYIGVYSLECTSFQEVARQ